LDAGAQQGEAERAASHAQREATDAATQVDRLSQRLAEVEALLAAAHHELHQRELERVRLDERLDTDRGRLAELEGEQEAAREERVRWQGEAGPLEARGGGGGRRRGPP